MPSSLLFCKLVHIEDDYSRVRTTEVDPHSHWATLPNTHSHPSHFCRSLRFSPKTVKNFNWVSFIEIQNLWKQHDDTKCLGSLSFSFLSGFRASQLRSTLDDLECGLMSSNWKLDPAQRSGQAELWMFRGWGRLRRRWPSSAQRLS